MSEIEWMFLLILNARRHPVPGISTLWQHLAHCTKRGGVSVISMPGWQWLQRLGKTFCPWFQFIHMCMALSTLKWPCVTSCLSGERVNIPSSCTIMKLSNIKPGQYSDGWLPANASKLHDRSSKPEMDTMSLLIVTEYLNIWRFFWTDRPQDLPGVGWGFLYLVSYSETTFGFVKSCIQNKTIPSEMQYNLFNKSFFFFYNK